MPADPACGASRWSLSGRSAEPTDGRSGLALLVTLALLVRPGSADHRIEVHEWGVLLWRGSSVVASGASGGPWFDPSEPVVMAPVIYIYGDPRDFELTVSSPGRIFDIYPVPDQFFGLDGFLRGLGSAVRWRGLRTEPAVAGGNVPWSDSFAVAIPGFQWALPMWRQPQALLVERTSDGFLDRFLYYEADLSGTGFPSPLPAFPQETAPDEEKVSGRVLVFRRQDDGSGVRVSAEPVEELLKGGTFEGVASASAGYDCILPLTVIRSWAAGHLTEAEIGAMWGTWEPYARYGDWEGDRLVVFPVPEALLDRVSDVELDAGAGIIVEYHRFFLGIAAM